ncbi:hypothetical protein PC129_g19748 [Phytophthora cactorum]|uniref:Uncharacterized protein n=1 Tax=Phytophthora cactorum TaxID=29920 RepID=A0A8T1HB08_9STRA|nr:hypothetical protein PC121_g16368 [Phytophthora cactorum]KAG3209237.1 hypothetical protein PC129_g19748 [Phytophthora cactorum]
MPPVKKRKATNTVRREEAEALRKQMAVLQNQVHKLQAQAEQAVMTPSDHLQLLTRSLRTKNVLQELLQDQKMVLAGAQSELMDFQEKRVINPLYTVDKDDLHPYDPKSRVRLDVSATLFMTEMRQKQPRGRKKDITGGFDCVQGTAGATADDEEGEKEMIVVIQSAVFLKAVSPQIDVRADALSAIGDGTASWIRVMLQSIREFVDAL